MVLRPIRFHVWNVRLLFENKYNDKNIGGIRAVAWAMLPCALRDLTSNVFMTAHRIPLNTKVEKNQVSFFGENVDASSISSEPIIHTRSIAKLWKKKHNHVVEYKEIY